MEKFFFGRWHRKHKRKEKYLETIDAYIRDGVYDKMLDDMEIKVGGKAILDIGCGYGQWFVALSRHHPERIVCVDIDESALQVAKEKLEQEEINNTSICKCDACCLPFKGESFDIIICYLVLPCVKNDEMLVKEISRVLKKDGVVFLGLHGVGLYLKYLLMGSPKALLAILSTMIYRAIGKKIYSDTFQGINQIGKLLNRYGIRVNKVSQTKFCTFISTFGIVGRKQG